MKLKAGKTCIVLAASVAAVLIDGSTGQAQSTPPKVATSGNLTRAVDEAQKAGEDARKAREDIRKAKEEALGDQARQFEFQTIADLQFGNPAMGNIRKAAEELRDAKDDDAKAKATSQLRDLLGKYFEEDMTHRQRELEGIEARLQKLHAQLERRRAKKDDIIDLQIKMSVNEADGLGFYSQPTGRPFNVFAPASGAASWGPGDDSDDAVKVPTTNVMPPMPPAAAVEATPSVAPTPGPAPPR